MSITFDKSIKVDERFKKNIESKIINFQSIKKIKSKKNVFRLRIGKIRVLFTKIKNIIHVFDIIKRDKGYKNIKNKQNWLK